MPIHYAIDKFKLLEEIRRLEESGYVVRFIIPDFVSENGSITHYIIIFDEP